MKIKESQHFFVIVVVSVLKLITIRVRPAISDRPGGNWISLEANYLFSLQPQLWLWSFSPSYHYCCAIQPCGGKPPFRISLWCCRHKHGSAKINEHFRPDIFNHREKQIFRSFAVEDLNRFTSSSLDFKWVQRKGGGRGVEILIQVWIGGGIEFGSWWRGTYVMQADANKTYSESQDKPKIAKLIGDSISCSL